MKELINGRYRARIGRTGDDLILAQNLRQMVFRAGEGADQDAFDGICQHVLIEEIATHQLVCCFRILPLSNGAEINQCYSAQYYDLSDLSRFDGKLVEIGRFCTRPGVNDADVLRLAWGALTRYVDDNAVEMLFGCSSFAGTVPDPYLEAFALLKERHLAPAEWRPRVKAESVYRFAQAIGEGGADQKRAKSQMPRLLNTYLSMGGWVSDHAVVDRQLNTLHVFTGLEIDAIPEARKRLLRAIAQ